MNTTISTGVTFRGREKKRCPRATFNSPIIPRAIAIPPARKPTLVQKPNARFSAFRISRTKTRVSSGNAFANA